MNSPGPVTTPPTSNNEITSHLIHEASEGPHVRGLVVGLVGPNLGRHVVRSSNLSLEEAVLHPLGDVHVSDLDGAVVAQEAVSGLKVAMTNLLCVQVCQRLEALNEVSPDHLLVDVLPALLIPLDLWGRGATRRVGGVAKISTRKELQGGKQGTHLLGQVTVTTILHNNTKFRIAPVQEGLKETNNVRVLDGRQEPNFIEGIGDLRLFHFRNIDALQSISFAIGTTLHLK